jgi:hypothetical protein
MSSPLQSRPRFARTVRAAASDRPDLTPSVLASNVKARTSCTLADTVALRRTGGTERRVAAGSFLRDPDRGPYSPVVLSVS